MHRNERIEEAFQFASVCPRCGLQQTQYKFNRGALLAQLESHLPIDVYCTRCRHSWVLSDEERSAIVDAIDASC